MRKISVFFALCLILAFPAAYAPAAQAPAQASPAAAAPGPEEQYVVTMIGIYPSSHPVMRDVLRPWADSLMEQTGGRLVIRFFEPSTAVNATRPGRSVRLGQVGLAVGLIGSEPDDFPLALLSAQSGGSSALRELSAAYWRMYTEIPELSNEFSGIKLLAVCAIDPLQLCMFGSLPYNSEFLRGRRFLVENSLTAKKMESFGAIPSIIPQSDFKMFMEDRIADGMVLSLTDISRLGLEERINGISLGDLENGAAWLGMHQGVWDMLPQDIRNIIGKSSGAALSQAMGAALSGLYRAELEKLNGGAVRLHYFSAEERAKFYLHMKNISQEAWQAAAREKGFNAKTLQDRIARIMTEAKVP